MRWRFAFLSGLVPMLATWIGCGGQESSNTQAPGPVVKPQVKRFVGDQAAIDALAKMAEVYAQLSSYQDTGKTVQVFTPRAEGATPRETVTRFQTRYARPNNFYLALLKPGENGSEELTAAYWTTQGPSVTESYQASSKALAKDTMMEALPRDVTVAKVVPRLLIKEIAPGHRKPINRMETPTLEPEATVDGHPCIVIKGYWEGMNCIVWIDSETSLLRQLQTTLGTQGGTDVTTLTFTPEANPEIPADAFVFSPPQ